MLKEKRHITYKTGDSIEAINQPKAWVEAYAGEVASIFQIESGESLDDLVATLGGEIHYQHIDDWLEVSGSLYVHAKGDFDIGLPHYTSPTRDRFTVAHELGHYFLHSQQGKIPIVAYRRGTSRIEWEANWFAAALLMPEAEFRKIHQKAGGNIYTVADHFGVSSEAAEVRKRVLIGGQ